MKKIKYKAWDIKIKKIYQVFKINFVDKLAFCGLYWHRYQDTALGEQEVILVQNTCLHDKDRKEIYHKDIMKWGNYKFTVEWDNKNGCWYGSPFIDNDIRGILSASSFRESYNIGNEFEKRNS